SGKIMGSHKKRIVVNHLGAGRFVIGVIDPHQGVPEKGSKQSMCLSKIRWRTAGGLEYFYQVDPHLQGGMAVAVKPGCKLGPLTLGKERLWALKITEPPRKKEARVGKLPSPG